MIDKLIAVYERQDTYRGHSKINHYHVPCEIRCYICDNSIERELGIMVNGVLAPDTYDIVVFNYKGDATYRHHFLDKDSANRCVKGYLNMKGAHWKKELIYSE